MALVKGFISSGRILSDSIGLTGGSDPSISNYSYGYDWGYGPPESSKPGVVVLGGKLPVGTPITPLIPGGDQFTFRRLNPYESKYQNKFQKLPLGKFDVTAYAIDVVDSVTPSDNITPLSVLGMFPFPMSPGNIQGILKPLKPYESKLFNKPNLLSPPPAISGSQSINDSVTPSDELIFDQTINISDNPTIADSLAMDRAIEVDDTLSLTDDFSSSSVIGIPGVFQIKPYEKPQLSGPYAQILGGQFTTTPTNWQQNIDDILSLSDAQDFVPPLIVTSIQTPLVPLPKHYEKKQLLGPYGLILTGFFIAPSVSYSRVINEIVFWDDSVSIERHPNVDDDVLVITDQIVLTFIKQQTISDSLVLSDNIITSGGVGLTLFQTISDSVIVNDEGTGVTLSLGNIVPHTPGYVAPSQQGPFMQVT